MQVFYFGCKGRIGHYLYAPGQTHIGDARGDTPWGYSVDGRLAPKIGKEEAPQGVAALHHKDGWTAISFWDRSVDHRGNSSSTFLAEGTFTFDEMITLAKEHFPSIMRRFPFTIVQHLTEEK